MYLSAGPQIDQHCARRWPSTLTVLDHQPAHWWLKRYTLCFQILLDINDTISGGNSQDTFICIPTSDIHLLWYFCIILKYLLYLYYIRFVTSTRFKAIWLTLQGTNYAWVKCCRITVSAKLENIGSLYLNYGKKYRWSVKIYWNGVFHIVYIKSVHHRYLSYHD